MSRLVVLSFWFALLITSQFLCAAQTPTAPATTVTEPALPIPTQIKKTVVFLNTSCLHNFTAEVGTLKQQLQQMPIQQQLAALQKLTSLTSRLRQLPQSLAKLEPDEVTRLNRSFVPNVNDPTSLANEVAWRADTLVKLTLLSPDDISALTPELLSLLPSDEHLGTGFLVLVPDPRVNPSIPLAANQTRGFSYLVTNRHVIQPGSENGQPCRVLRVQITMNRKGDSTHPTAYAETSVIPGPQEWNFSEDNSVDLAVIPLGVPTEYYNFFVVPTDLFVADEDISKKAVVEGNPVIFSGLFVQSFAKTHRLEPIVRSGTLAMIPDGPVETTMNKKLGRLFFAEVHTFGGNSGSPIFIDANRFSGVISGPSYRLLGVISGEVIESADFSLNVTTTIAMGIGANSDVSTVVPAGELLKILHSKKLQAERDAAIRKQPQSSSPPSPATESKPK